jgi:hypothetical protein
LNTALVLIGFINDGTENWSFSRLGIHYLDNFFGLVRQSAHGDDQFRRAIQIVTQSTVMVPVMDGLNVRPRIRGQDNLGDTIIGPGTTTFSSELVDTLVQSFLQLSPLHFDAHDPSQLLSRDELITILANWVATSITRQTPAARLILPEVFPVMESWPGTAVGKFRMTNEKQNSHLRTWMIRRYISSRGLVRRWTNEAK